MTPLAIAPGPLDTVFTHDGFPLYVRSSRPKTPTALSLCASAAGGEHASPADAPAGTPDSLLASAGEGSASRA